MPAASLCIWYNKFYSQPHLTTFGASNMYNRFVGSDHHPYRKDYGMRGLKKQWQSETIGTATKKILDADSIHCFECSTFYTKPSVTSLK